MSNDKDANRDDGTLVIGNPIGGISDIIGGGIDEVKPFEYPDVVGPPTYPWQWGCRPPYSPGIPGGSACVGGGSGNIIEESEIVL